MKITDSAIDASNKIQQTTEQETYKTQKRNLTNLVFGTILILAILILGFSFYSRKVNTEKGNPELKNQSEPENTITYKETPNADISENLETYKNDRYGFEITNLNDWVIYVDNTETFYINLRYKTDKVPARHGFSIHILENPKYQTLKDLCNMGAFNEASGFLCRKNITSTKITIGNIEWERVEKGSIGVVPSFEVILGTLHDNKFFYIVDEGYGFDEISKVLTSFTFSEAV